MRRRQRREGVGDGIARRRCPPPHVAAAPRPAGSRAAGRRQRHGQPAAEQGWAGTAGEPRETRRLVVRLDARTTTDGVLRRERQKAWRRQVVARRRDDLDVDPRPERCVSQSTAASSGGAVVRTGDRCRRLMTTSAPRSIRRPGTLNIAWYTVGLGQGSAKMGLKTAVAVRVSAVRRVGSWTATIGGRCGRRRIMYGRVHVVPWAARQRRSYCPRDRPEADRA